MKMELAHQQNGIWCKHKTSGKSVSATKPKVKSWFGYVKLKLVEDKVAKVEALLTLESRIYWYSERLFGSCRTNYLKSEYDRQKNIVWWER
jgi:hypothetical protein